MQKIKIGVSGNKGSFSEEATLYYCQKKEITDFELYYLIGSENALRSVTSGEVDLAIFPLENSNGGMVLESVHAMSNYVFGIDDIFEIDVKHNLLVKKGAKTDDITKVVSHPQALKQCRMYLRRVWGNVELEEYTDTASAAKDLSLGILEKNCAVIAPRICSELYGLDILEENIQDLKFNYTSFLAATKKNKI